MEEMAQNSVSSTLNPLTNAHTVRSRPTPKDVERFRNGSVCELIERVTHFTSGFIERVTHFTSGFIVNFIVNYKLTLSIELFNYSNHANVLPIHEDLTDESVHVDDVNKGSEECRNVLSVYKDKPCRDSNKTATFQGITLFILLFLIFIAIITCKLNICFAGFYIVLCGIYLLIACRSMDVHVEMYISSFFNDCDILDKTNNLTVHVYNDAVVTINISKNTRSRYSQYIYYNYSRVYKASARHKRDREPSRLPARALKRLATKSKKLRRFVYANIRSRVPKSSKLYYHITSTIGGHSFTMIKKKCKSSAIQI